MARQLTRKQKIFTDHYLKTGNGVQSAVRAYKTDYKTAAVIASENLTKPKIIEYLIDNAKEASDTVLELMRDKEVRAEVRLNAAKDVLDRAGYKPVDRKQTEVKKITISLNSSDIH